MPVHTKAARSTASNDGRETLASDNDFTVLFERVPITARGTSPPRIQLPEPPPSPPVAPERPTPLVMASPPVARTQTVIVRPTGLVRGLRVAVFLTLGCLVGVGVERLVRARIVASWAEAGGSSAPAAAAPISSDEGALKSGAPAAAGASGTRLKLHGAHHHHVHRPPASTGAPVATGVDAGTGDDEGDDMAAAMEALTKAKGEVTLP